MACVALTGGEPIEEGCYSSADEREDVRDRLANELRLLGVAVEGDGE